MRKQKSLGDFRKIAPSRLVGDEPDDVEDFFLVLAVIYNDLKGLVNMETNFARDNQPPKPGEVSAYAGEYSGTITQFYKLIASMINEFLAFLEEHEHIYTHPRFTLFLFRLPRPLQKEWHDILDAAFKRSKKGDEKNLGYKLLLIRNNVASHYLKSEKVLRHSYKEFFAEKDKFGADHAYYSDGGSMKSTRFYYADAAVQRYLQDTASKQHGVDYDKDQESFRQLQLETFQLVRTMNMVIANLLRQFIAERSKG